MLASRTAWRAAAGGVLPPLCSARVLLPCLAFCKTRLAAAFGPAEVPKQTQIPTKRAHLQQDEVRHHLEALEAVAAAHVPLHLRMGVGFGGTP